MYVEVRGCVRTAIACLGQRKVVEGKLGVPQLIEYMKSEIVSGSVAFRLMMKIQRTR